MIDPSWRKHSIPEPGGAWTDVDRDDVPLHKSLAVENAQFGKGKIETRLGFGDALGVSQAAVSFFNWVSNLGAYLFTYAVGTGIRLVDIAAGSPAFATVESIATANVAAQFAQTGSNLYAAIYGTAAGATYQTGVEDGRVISYQSAAFVSDKILPAPMTYVPGAPTEPAGTGNVTKGTHYFGYIIEYRSGHFGRISPDSATGSNFPSLATVAPVSFTAAGAKKAEWILNTTWAAGAVRVHGVMTPVSNRAQWFFVPGADAAVVGGVLSSVTLTFNVTDEDLWQSIDINDATDYTLIQSQSPNGTAPWKPSFCGVYRDRMVYVAPTTDSTGNTIASVYVSEGFEEYQKVLLERALLAVPNLRNIVCHATIGSQLFMFGPNYTFVTSDNGFSPREWRVDSASSRIGTPALHGAGFAGEEITHLWVADKEGLYKLTPGGYSRLPLSYYQTDQWKRINWAVPHTLQVIPDISRLLVYVKAALDSATTPSHIMCWDLRHGDTYDRADFTIWTVGGSFTLSAIGMVLNNLSAAIASAKNKLELWMMSSAAQAVYRQKVRADTTPWRDGSAGIAFRWKTATVPPGGGEPMQQHGVKLGATGSGTLACTQYISDDSLQVPMPTLLLAATQPIMPFLGAGGLSETASYEFTQSAADDHVVISYLEAYASPHSSL
jgi:hypothetical protein